MATPNETRCSSGVGADVANFGGPALSAPGRAALLRAPVVVAPPQCPSPVPGPVMVNLVEGTQNPNH